MLEKDLCNAIVDFLNFNGYYCWRNNAGLVSKTYKGKSRMIKIGYAGHSDIFGIRKSDGKFIAIEVKLPGKKFLKPTVQQQLFVEKIQLMNGLAGVATSIEEALAIVKD